MTGTVKWFNAGKGYGFVILDEDKEKEAFVHFSEIKMEGFKKLLDGQKVSFELTTEENGKLRAVNVVPIE